MERLESAQSMPCRWEQLSPSAQPPPTASLTSTAKANRLAVWGSLLLCQRQAYPSKPSVTAANPAPPPCNSTAPVLQLSPELSSMPLMAEIRRLRLPSPVDF